jgi:hypothetical protein
MDIAKSEGKYTVDQMQQMATIASTADGLNVEGNNFKVCALTGSPDMLLFACERIKELESFNMNELRGLPKDIDLLIQSATTLISHAKKGKDLGGRIDNLEKCKDRVNEQYVAMFD